MRRAERPTRVSRSGRAPDALKGDHGCSIETETGIDTRLFIGGEFVEADERRDVREPRPVHGRRRLRGRGGEPGGRRARGRGRGRRVPRVVADPACRAAGDLPEGGRGARVPAGRGRRRCSPGRPAARSASACSRCISSPGSSARRRRSAYAPLGEVIPSDTGRLRDGAAAPGRRRRRDRAVERGADPLARSIALPLALGNTVVLKPSSGRRRSAGLLWGEVFAEAGLPAGVLNIVTHAPGEAAGGRRRAGREPARPPAQLHRLDRHGPQARRGGRAPAQARRARARRLQPADRPRRRRPRVRGQRGGVRGVPPPGADLHVGAADHRRAARSPTRSSRGSPRRRSGLKAGDPKEHDTIIGPLINRERALDRAGAGRGRRRARARRCSRAASAEGPCFQADAARGRPGRRGVRARGDLRPGRRDRDRRLRRRGGRARQRDGVRALVRDHDRRRGPRPRARAGDRRRGSSTSTTSRWATSRRCRSAASRTRASAGSAATAVVDEFTETALGHGPARLTPVPVLGVARRRAAR